MASHIESNQLESQMPRPSRLARYYQSYRQWRKSRRRKTKASKQLQEMLRFYSQFVQEGDLCFDIGANIGNRTEVFDRLGATVVAVEPQQDCVRILRERFGDRANVHIVQKALDDALGRKDIFITSGSTLSSMSQEWIKSVQQSGRFEGHVWNKKGVVETTTFDLLIGEYGKPSFSKIDVEGFEYNVLRGLSGPVKAMSFEFHPEHAECAVNCIRHLQELGAAEFNYSEGESMSLSMSSWVGPDAIIEVLTSPPTKDFGDVYVRFGGN